MNKTRITLNLLAAALFTLAFSSLAQAQATRTWVSGVGDDVNPCSRTAPCKTFAGAISKTATGGEINALDPGGFGTLTITKSMTVDGGSAFASMLSSSVNGVNINAAVSASDPQRRVTLRRLSINGAGNPLGVKGINVTGNGISKLNVENCYIQNFTTAGIDITSAEGSAGTRVSIKDTVITNTGTVGLQTNSTNAAGFISLAADNLRIENCTSGVIAKDRSFLTLRNSFIHACTTVGVSIQAPSNSAGINLESTVLFSVGTGVQGGGAGTVVDLSNSSILNNSTGISTGGGAVNSHGNNQIANNTNPGTVPAPVGQQ
jgi:hypothetical protein